MKILFMTPLVQVRAMFSFPSLEKGNPAYRLFWLCGGLHCSWLCPDGLCEQVLVQ